jgi:diguanylate cyclase (GGDEF)-like protein/PAS domain S-box-containing protein
MAFTERCARGLLRLIDDTPLTGKLLIAPAVFIVVFGMFLLATIDAFKAEEAAELRLKSVDQAWIKPMNDCKTLAARLQTNMFRLTSFGLMGANLNILATIAADIQQDDSRLKALMRDPPGLLDAPSFRSALLASYADYRRASTNAVKNLLQNPGFGATTARNAAISLDSVISFTSALQVAGARKMQQEVQTQAAIRARTEWRLVIGIILGSLGVILIKLLIGWRISAPLRSLTGAMSNLARRQYDIQIPAGAQRDEVGSMARAVQVFREGLIQADAVAAQQQATQAFLVTVLENLPIPVIVCEVPTLRCVLMNPAFEHLLHINRADMIGHTPSEIWPSEFGTRVEQIDHTLIASGGMQVEQDIPIFAHTERERLTNITRLAIPGPDGKPQYIIKLIEDITERRRSERRLQHMAQYDSLTELANRTLFAERLAEALIKAGEAKRPVGLLALDLDRFKEVNDTLGHAAGDILLCTLARRLQRCLRDGDTLARLGGDEFAVIQCHTKSLKDAESLAKRLLACVQEPVDIDGQKVFVGLSAGITLSDQTVTAAELIQQADLALYDAKQSGRGNFRVFMPTLSARLRERRTMEQELRHALEAKQVHLLYQPSVCLGTGEIAGAEALMRWTHPILGAVPPTVFIPLAEETGLIGPLGLWLLQEACREAASWPRPVRVAVNVSPVQFRQPGFAAHVRDALAACGLEASRLELEITEGVLMRDTADTLAILADLRTIGVRIVLDDFGTGYASLAYLQTFCFDKLKIDRSFVQNVETDPTALAIMRAVLGLSESLNMTSTAEGIEQEAQADLLRILGCSEAQGYLFWRPMPATAFRGLLSEIPPLSNAANLDTALVA